MLLVPHVTIRLTRFDKVYDLPGSVCSNLVQMEPHDAETNISVAQNVGIDLKSAASQRQNHSLFLSSLRARIAHYIA